MVKTSVKPLPLFRLITVSYLARTLLVQANSANVFDLLPMPLNSLSIKTQYCTYAIHTRLFCVFKIVNINNWRFTHNTENMHATF